MPSCVSRAFDECHSVLCSEGLSSTIVGNDGSHFPLWEVTFCDDTTLPVVSSAPLLVSKTSVVLEVALSTFCSYGPSLSWIMAKPRQPPCLTAMAPKPRCARWLPWTADASFIGGCPHFLSLVTSHKHLSTQLCVSNELKLEIVSKAVFIKSGLGPRPLHHCRRGRQQSLVFTRDQSISAKGLRPHVATLPVFRLPGPCPLPLRDINSSSSHYLGVGCCHYG